MGHGRGRRHARQVATLNGLEEERARLALQLEGMEGQRDDAEARRRETEAAAVAVNEKVFTLAQQVTKLQRERDEALQKRGMVATQVAKLDVLETEVAKQLRQMTALKRERDELQQVVVMLRAQVRRSKPCILSNP